MMIIPKSCFVSNNMSNVNVMYHSVKLNIQAKLETSWVLVDEKNGRPFQRMKDSAETVPLLAHTSHTLKGIMVFIVQTTKKCSNVISIGLILIISSMSSWGYTLVTICQAKLLIFAANIRFPGNQPSIRSPSVSDFKSCADMVALAPSHCREEREPMAAQHRVFAIFWVRQPFDKGLKLDESSPSTDLREMFVKSRISQ